MAKAWSISASLGLPELLGLKPKHQICSYLSITSTPPLAELKRKPRYLGCVGVGLATTLNASLLRRAMSTRNFMQPTWVLRSSSMTEAMPNELLGEVEISVSTMIRMSTHDFKRQGLSQSMIRPWNSGWMVMSLRNSMGVSMVSLQRV